MNVRRAATRKKFSGVVLAAGNMAKTITVSVERFPWHPKVRKQIRRTKTYLVHDPGGEARVGDRVTIEETRPLSKRKHFRLVSVDVKRQQLAPIP